MQNTKLKPKPKPKKVESVVKKEIKTPEKIKI